MLSYHHFFLGQLHNISAEVVAAPTETAPMEITYDRKALEEAIKAEKAALQESKAELDRRHEILRRREEEAAKTFAENQKNEEEKVKLATASKELVDREHRMVRVEQELRAREEQIAAREGQSRDMQEQIRAREQNLAAFEKSKLEELKQRERNLAACEEKKAQDIAHAEQNLQQIERGIILRQEETKNASEEFRKRAEAAEKEHIRRSQELGDWEQKLGAATVVPQTVGLQFSTKKRRLIEQDIRPKPEPNENPPESEETANDKWMKIAQTLKNRTTPEERGDLVNLIGPVEGPEDDDESL